MDRNEMKNSVFQTLQGVAIPKSKKGRERAYRLQLERFRSLYPEAAGDWLPRLVAAHFKI